MLKLNLGETLTQHRHLLLLLLQEVTCSLPTTPAASILPPQKILNSEKMFLSQQMVD